MKDHKYVITSLLIKIYSRILTIMTKTRMIKFVLAYFRDLPFKESNEKLI